MARPDHITVLIVDAFAHVRHGLIALLATTADISVVGEAADGETAVQQALVLRPDVVLIDCIQPDLDGLGAICAIREGLPEARVLVLTNFGDDATIFLAFEAGAHGFLLKGALTTDVIAAIRDVHAGTLAPHPGFASVPAPAA
jgi:DNA-binding NarL/FixJ family response regulator